MRPIPVAVQTNGVRCAHCGDELLVGEEVLWRHGEKGGLYHYKCPSPVMMEREACLQVIERRLGLLKSSTLVGVALAMQNLRVVLDEIAGAAHLGNAVWPPGEREESTETWRDLAESACEILGRSDVYDRLHDEDRDDASAQFEKLGRLIDRTDKVEGA
jgi:hypothetical protein